MREFEAERKVLVVFVWSYGCFSSMIVALLSKSGGFVSPFVFVNSSSFFCVCTIKKYSGSSYLGEIAKAWSENVMRLLVEFRALRDCIYDLRYHHKLQGFLYSLLKNSAYRDLHNKRGYKFFSFSNIFPSVDMRRGDVRRFLVASPDSDLIGVFRDRLDGLRHDGSCVNVGEMSFRIEGVSVLKPRVGRSCTLVTGTPVVIRIPKANYARYGINPPKDYPYVYWRKRYPFDAFIKQLEDNLFKKYNMFYGASVESFPLFEQFVFKKQVCNHIIIEGREVKVFGSLWRFIFNHLYKETQKIVQFGLDIGFGELNSLGFGFMNIMMEKSAHLEEYDSVSKYG